MNPARKLKTEPVGHHSLIEAIASGSEAALRKLYDEYSSLVYSIAKNMLQDTQEAEEATQDAFVRVWKYSSKFDPRKRSLKGWLVMLTRSASLDRIRRRNCRPDRRPGLVASFGDADIADSLPNNMPENRENIDRVLESLESLRSEYRDAIELAFFKGYSQKEIAQELSIPQGTAKTFLRRGLLELKKLARRHK